MACVAANSLVRTIELEFWQPRLRPIFQEYQIIPSNRYLMQSLHQKLQFLIDLFDESRMDCDKTIKYLEELLRVVAFQAEDEIEHLVADLYKEKKEEKSYNEVTVDPKEELRCILQRAIEGIDAIKEVYEKTRAALQERKTTPDAFPKSDDDKVIRKGDSDSQSKDKMVGKNDEFDTIMKMLIQHPSKKREVVRIEGMGGIGKTTLARRVYDDKSVASYFDKRAWVVASQNHDEKKMFKDLLKSMGEEESYSDEESYRDENLAVKQELNGNRYLVVVDDVWSKEAWDVVQTCFPDDGNGSRVLLTTRNAVVANYTCSSNEFSHQMQLLDPSESWNLFNEKTKANKSKEAGFERIMRPIVEKCKGLPLAIIVLAGLFSKLNTLNEGKNIVEAINSSATTTIDEECSRILSLSYNHLPHNLRACFLYLGVFPEDEEFKASEIARLWAAEGLVKTFEDESFDAVAERHIRELMDRNLIIASERSSCGRKIKRFMMHDLMHAFCVSEAQKENLLLIVCENNGFNFLQKCPRWVSIQCGFDISTLTLYSSLERCRSIFCHSRMPSHSFLFNLKGFKLLRVFYYPHANSIPVETEDIVHMRYILHPCQVKLPSLLVAWNVKNAWNLQTININKYNAWEHLNSPQLHHISLPRTSRVSTPSHPPKFVSKNLQCITSVTSILCTEEFFTHFPCLKGVKIWCARIGGCNDSIENLAYLQQLESLTIRVTSMDLHMAPINSNIVLLNNLKKLKFESTRFEWKEMNVLCKLTGLKVLKLKVEACVGKEWELPEDEEFCQLIFLKIDTCIDLKHWKASCDHFPKLERLVLDTCIKLEEIPAEFAEIPTLESIELRRCPPSAVTSAKQIENEQHEYGNNDMIVIEK